jgi:hypothetical protein
MWIAWILDIQLINVCIVMLYYGIEERTEKSRRPTNPKFSICCQQGKVKLPFLKEAPIVLRELLDGHGDQRCRRFIENLRAYNALLAMTSMGGNVDGNINDGKGPYIFRLNGQNHHKIGSLLPIDGHNPRFAQLYIFDTENEVKNRISVMNRSSKHNGIDKDVLQALVQMLDENNILVQSFRMARDRFQGSQVRDFKLRLIGTRSTDGREHNLPSASEIAAIIIGDFDPESGYRDIIVESKEGHLKRINELHPSFMPMQYPLLFPYGEDGFCLGILYREIDGRKKTKRTSVTMREYYAYRLQERESEGKTLHHGRRLFQQFVVDSYTCVEQSRLRYFRDKQKQLRSEVYHGLKDAVFRGDTTPASIGKRIVLPSSFTGGPRYMIQCYQDAMAICRWFGYPDLFIRFTCNSKWPEIESFLSMHPGLKVEDRPDIVARVFKIKLNNLMHDLKRGSHFGRVLAGIYYILQLILLSY